MNRRFLLCLIFAAAAACAHADQGADARGFEAFVTAGAIYLAIMLALVAALHAGERRWLAHLRPCTA